jgi:hypothetical protein
MIRYVLALLLILLSAMAQADALTGNTSVINDGTAASPKALPTNSKWFAFGRPLSAARVFGQISARTELRNPR